MLEKVYCKRGNTAPVDNAQPTPPAPINENNENDDDETKKKLIEQRKNLSYLYNQYIDQLNADLKAEQQRLRAIIDSTENEDKKIAAYREIENVRKKIDAMEDELKLTTIKKLKSELNC